MEPGRLVPAGTGPSGEEVYALARRHSGAVVERALSGLAAHYGVPLIMKRVGAREAQRHGVPRSPERVQDADRTGAAPAGRAVFYYCYGSAHTSVVCAAIHLGSLPRNRPPRVSELIRLPLFDRAPNAGIGTPTLVGVDPLGREVFVIGGGRERGIVARAAADFLRAAGRGRIGAVFLDSLPPAGVPVRIGGFLSRRLGLVLPGRCLAALGIRRCYGELVRIVERATGCATRQAGCAARQAGRAPPLDCHRGLMDNKRDETDGHDNRCGGPGRTGRGDRPGAG